MSRLFAAIPAVLFLLPTLSFGQEKSTTLSTLPVKRVVLFKNGVGYFEHIGKVRGDESVTISFTSGQLNDVLKSLTVLDLNGGRIAGVGYGTSAPLNRQQQSTCGTLGEKETLSQLLAGLRGSRIEVRGSSPLSGRLLSVEHKTRTIGAATQDLDYLSLISETGELHTVEMTPATSVRLLEPGLAAKLDRCLNLAAAERDADVRNMVIATQGSGDRNLLVSYISEVPVWKSTYRLVLSSKQEKSSLLQGWAIVDNVVGEDWNSVELSLVAGAPQSFIQNLSKPYYAERPTVGLPDTVSTTPQTYEATLKTGTAALTGAVTDPSGAGISHAVIKILDENGDLIAQTTTNSSGAYRLETLPAGILQLRAESPGFQIVTINPLAYSPGTSLQQNLTLQVGNAAQTVQLQASAPVSANVGSGRMLGSVNPLGGARGTRAGSGFGRGAGGGFGGGSYQMRSAQFNAAAMSQALGDLFEYKLKDPITILKNRSALVPIVQASVTAEKVSVWNDRNGLPRPERAVWITNTSGVTLDGGSVSVLEDETFTGEGIVDPIQPGEKRLLSYATDLAVNATSKMGTESHRISRVVIAKGILRQEIEMLERKTYTFRNEDSKPRTIIVEHPVRSGYQLLSQTRPAETTPDWMRFKLNVEPKTTASLEVEEARPAESNISLSDITPEQVSLFVSQRTIDAAIQSALQNVLAEKAAISRLDDQKDNIEKQTQAIFDDQQRLRENVKALKGVPEEKPLLQRYTQQLNDQESQLESLKRQDTDLEERIDAANDKLDDMIQQLAFDIKL